MTTLKTVTPERAAQMLRAGAVLVDVREADEHAREHIAGARHRALSKLESTKAGSGQEILIFHCRSGMRTQGNAGKLQAASGNCEAYILEGGLEGWKKAGLPVSADSKQPIEIMRQVQIAVGCMVLAGVILGLAWHPAFFALPAIAGAGLLVAGITGNCALAKLLRLMPWNRRAAA
jgi:rhodanese-related sulfurtransferase